MHCTQTIVKRKASRLAFRLLFCTNNEYAFPSHFVGEEKKKLSTKWRPLYRILESVWISTWMVGPRVAARMGFAVTGLTARQGRARENSLLSRRVHGSERDRGAARSLARAPSNWQTWSSGLATRALASSVGLGRSTAHRVPRQRRQHGGSDPLGRTGQVSRSQEHSRLGSRRDLEASGCLPRTAWPGLPATRVHERAAQVPGREYLYAHQQGYERSAYCPPHKGGSLDPGPGPGGNPVRTDKPQC